MQFNGTDLYNTPNKICQKFFLQTKIVFISKNIGSNDWLKFD